MKSLPFEFGNHTDKGNVREVNEDSMAFYAIKDGYLMVVADGMGGHAAGDEASKLAIESIKNYFESVNSFENIPHLIIQAIEVANQNIYHYSQQNPEKKGMGTTVVLAFIHGNQISIGHVGDSRAYRFNPETGLQTLTKDHSFVQELVNQGIITEEEALYHPRKNEITRALGIHEYVVPDIQQHTIRPNDVFALMTDGICSLLTFQQILEILSNSHDTAQQMAEKLVHKANELGGYDNSTVQIISYTKNNSTEQTTSNIDTQKIENLSTENIFQKEVHHPKSSTQDSALRYYVFIGSAILTIAIIFYYFLLNSRIIEPQVANVLTPQSQFNDSLSSQDSLPNELNSPEILYCEYKVKKNEKLEVLSKIFNYPVDSIKSLNHIKNDIILERSILKFPVQTIHEIKKGDKIEKLAENYGVKTHDILKINNIKNPRKLSIGTKIYIPLKENNN